MGDDDMMRAADRRRLIAAVVVTLIAILAIGYGANFVASDRCVDAGGRWDDAAGLCMFPPAA